MEVGTGVKRIKEVMIKYLLSLFLFFIPTFLFALTPCEVVRVIDGDTFIATCNGSEHRIRFREIDAPERKQEYGPESTICLETLLLGKDVTLDIHATDVYGRIIATVYVDGKDAGLQMVKSGAAWPYRNSGTPEYLLSAQEAKVKRLGLWGDPNPVPPWQFRKKAKQSK